MKDCGGIRTVEDLKARCRVDEDTGCWHWSLYAPKGVAKVSIHRNGKPQSIYGRRAALILVRGEASIKGHRVYAAPFCTAKDCVNPRHAQSGTAAECGKAHIKAGMHKNNPAKVRSAREAAAKYHAKLTMELARQIRCAEGTYLEVAKRFGVSRATVWRVRTNHGWKEGAGVMPTADVFAWAQNVQREAA